MARTFLLLAIVLAAVFFLAVAEGSAEDELEISVVDEASKYYVGVLYDARTQKVIPSRSLWTAEQLKDKTTEPAGSSVSMKFSQDQSFQSKSSLLDVNAQVKISVLGGLVDVSGAASYLKDSKSSNSEAAVSFYYKKLSRFEHLNMDHFVNATYKSEAISDGLATHVVTGILYGANAIVKFSSQSASKSDVSKIAGSLEISISKALPGLDIKGSGSVSAGDGEDVASNYVSSYVEADFNLGLSVQTFESAVKYIQKLVECPEEQCPSVPKKIFLYPLSLIDSKISKYKDEISERLQNDVINTFETFSDVLVALKDLRVAASSALFSSIEVTAGHIYEQLDILRSSFAASLQKLLPSIRGGQVDVSKLKDLNTRMLSFLQLSKVREWTKDRSQLVSAVNDYLSSVPAKSQSDMLKDRKVKKWVVLKIFTNDTYENDLTSLIDSFLEDDTVSPSRRLSFTAFALDRERLIYNAMLEFLNIFESNQNTSDVVLGFNEIYEQTSGSEIAKMYAFDSRSGIYTPLPSLQVTEVKARVDGETASVSWNPVVGASGFKIRIVGGTKELGFATSLENTKEYQFPRSLYSGFSAASVCAIVHEVCGPWSEESSFFAPGSRNPKIYNLQNPFTVASTLMEQDQIESPVSSRTGYQYKATLETGSLVVKQYFGGKLLRTRWTSPVKPAETTGYKMVLTNKGVLSIRKNVDGDFASEVWKSQNEAPVSEDYKLLMQQDGNLVVYDDQGKPIWSTDTWSSGNSILQNEVLCPSPSDTTKIDSLILGDLRASIGADGNFVLQLYQKAYKTWGRIWKSGTSLAGGCLKLKEDGSLVVFKDDATENIIAGPFQGKAPFRLQLQSDIRIVILDSQNHIHWASNEPYDLKKNLPEGARLCTGDALSAEGLRASVNGASFIVSEDQTARRIFYKVDAPGGDNCVFLSDTGSLSFVRKSDGAFVKAITAPLDLKEGPYSLTVEAGRGVYIHRLGKFNLNSQSLYIPPGSSTECKPGNLDLIDHLDQSSMDCTHIDNEISYITRFKMQNCGGDKYKFDYSCAYFDDNAASLKLTQSTQKDVIGKLEFLDRHNVACPDGSAISGIFPKTEESGSGRSFRIEYNCMSLPESSKCTERYTQCDLAQEQSLIYMDRHDLQCGPTSALNSFQFTRDGCSGNQLRFRYKCCELGANLLE